MLDAGDQRRRCARRPDGHDLGHDGPRGLRLAAFGGLDLDVGMQPCLAHQGECFLERRHPFAGEGGIEPGPGVEPADGREIGILDRPGAVRGAVQLVVVKHDAALIGGKLGVELDPGRADAHGVAEAGQGIFGRHSSRPAMSDDLG